MPFPQSVQNALAPEDYPRRQVTKVVRSALPPWKVLVVDDDEDDFVLVRDLLVVGTDSVVVWARSHAEALSIVESGFFDVCLVDWRLGPDDGLGLVAEMTNRRPDVPTILLTGLGGKDADAQALAAGASDYLEKNTLTEAALERSIRYAISAGLTQARLRSGRQAAHQMIESLPIGVVLFALDGEILDVNKAALSIGDVESLEALRSRPAAGYLSNSNVWSGLLDDLERHGTVESRIVDAETASGEPIVLRTAVSLTSLGDGETVVLGTVEDVTEEVKRSRISAAYQRILAVQSRSDSLQQGLFEILSETCIATDASYGELWRPNDGRLALVGHFSVEPSLVAMASRSIGYTFGPGEGVPGIAWSSGEVQEIDDIATADEFVRSGLAKQFDLNSLTALPIFYGNEMVAVLVFFTRNSPTVQGSLRSLVPDLQSMIRTFVERLKSQARVSLLLGVLENTPDLVLVLDPTGRIEYSNEAAQRALQMNSRGEDDDVSVFNLASKETRGAFRTQVMPSLATQGIWTGELPVSVGRKEIVMSHVVLAHRGEDLDINSISVVSRDLTDRHQIQSDLRQANERLQALIRTKEQFIATVSHELRTPLTSVLGFSEVLRDDTGNGMSSEQREIVEAIADEASDLAAIIDDLLVAARLQEGSLAFKIVSVNLQAQVRQVLEALHLADRVTVAGEEMNASGDPGRVRQIIRNLLTNAVRHGGPIIEVRTSIRDGLAEVTVEDNGHGIDASDQARLFEPYQQNHTAVGRPGSLGIGLTISRNLAEGMSGTLEYRGTSEGSEFSLSLPRYLQDISSAGNEVESGIEPPRAGS